MMDTRDWIVITLMAAIEAAAIVFLFYKPSTANFVTFGTLSGTLVSAYHWMVIRDSKEKDA